MRVYGMETSGKSEFLPASLFSQANMLNLLQSKVRELEKMSDDLIKF